MALSGTYTKAIGSGYRVQLEWTATQNVANNTSTVTAKVYWMSLGSSYTVSSSATKSGDITIDGTKYSFSGGGLASLSGNQKKLLHTASKTITHNSDGTKTFSVSGTFGMAVTLSGTYYASGTASGSATLDTIPRASSLTSSPNFTAGNSLSVTISRASSSFTHNIGIQVDGTAIKNVTGVGTSATISFTSTEIKNIFTKLADQASKPCIIIVDTYSGSTKIGGKNYNGTCSNISQSTISFSNFDIGNSIPVTISAARSDLTHNIELAFGNMKATWTGLSGTSHTLTLNQTQINDMFAQIPTANSGVGTIYVRSYYSGVSTRPSSSKGFTAYVKNANPTIASSFSYYDGDTTTVAITGDNQTIVQNKSILKVKIPPNLGQAQKGASISNYVVTVNGVNRTVNPSSSEVQEDFGKLNVSSNISLTVRVTDSRGNQNSATKTISVAAYAPQTVSPSAIRKNNYENETSISVSGSYSPLSIGGQSKNSIKGGSYRYRVKNGTWSATSPFSISQTGASYSSTVSLLDLDNTKEFEVEYSIEDAFGIITSIKNVSAGQPVLFIDAKKNSVGVNAFPQEQNVLEVNGKIILNGSELGSGGGGSISLIEGPDPKLTIRAVPNTEGEQGRIVFEGGGSGQGVQLRFNDYDNTKAPYGLHIERSPDNAQTDKKPYLKIDGELSTETINGLKLGVKQGSSYVFNAIPVVASDGVMEVGKYIDFHNTNNDTKDYAQRLQSESDHLALSGGKFHINANGEVLRLTSTDHAYISIFEGSTRRGYMGMGSGTTDNLTFRAENGEAHVIGQGIKIVAFETDGTQQDILHTRFRDANGVGLKIGGGGYTYIHSGEFIEHIGTPIYTGGAAHADTNENLIFQSNDRIVFYWSQTGTTMTQNRGMFSHGAALLPNINNEITFGNSGFQWKKIYLGDTVIGRAASEEAISLSRKTMRQDNLKAEAQNFLKELQIIETEETFDIAEKSVLLGVERSPNYFRDKVFKTEKEEIDGKEFGGETMSLKGLLSSLILSFQEQQSVIEEQERAISLLTERVERLEQKGV